LLLGLLQVNLPRSPMTLNDESYKDGFRKPHQLLEFARLQPSDKVLDVTTGFGYLARHISNVSTNYPVVAQNGSEWRGFFESIGIAKVIRRLEANGGKIKHVWSSMEDPASSRIEEYDLITMQNTYHDLYDMPIDRSKFFASIRRALKSDSGRFLLIDHHAAKGRGAKDAGANRGLHRIEECVVRKELQENGFVVVDTSNMFDSAKDNCRTCAWTNPMKDTKRFVLLCQKTKF